MNFSFPLWAQSGQVLDSHGSVVCNAVRGNAQAMADCLNFIEATAKHGTEPTDPATAAALLQSL